MAEGLEQVTEQVADQLEEVAEVTRHLTGREVGFFLAGTGVGVAAGFAVGYFVMGKRLETKYQKLADEEVAKMREHYQQLRVALEGEAERRKPLEQLVVERGYTSTEVKRDYTEEEQAAIDETNAKFPAEGPEETTPAFGPTASEATEEVETHNVFEETEEEWNYDVEIAKREELDKDVPYIIHVDEFRQNENVYEQVTMTYYEGDDILADTRNTIIEDMDAVIGLGNLGRWGHGSKDPNITYVRNEELKVDIEILRDRGSFHETVHSIRHSSERRSTTRGRFDDEE